MGVFVGNRPVLQRAAGSHHPRNCKAGECDGGTQRCQSNGVGAPDDFIQINAGHTIAEPKDYLFPETMYRI